MTDDDARRMLAVLEQIREQAAHATRLQDRAEAIQDRSAAMVAGSRKVLAIVLPLILVLVVVLVVYVGWLILRR